MSNSTKLSSLFLNINERNHLINCKDLVQKKCILQKSKNGNFNNRQPHLALANSIQVIPAILANLYRNNY